MGFKIYDLEGAEQTLEWLHAKYGPINVRISPDASAFRVVELRESYGPAAYVAKVLGDQGQPLDQELVARHWPYRDFNPDLDPLPEGGEWFTTGVYGPTNANGDIGFGAGGDDYYHPENGGIGASSFWVLEYRSDCVENIGMLGGTAHALMNPVFMWIDGEEPPDPPEPPDDCPKLDNEIADIESAIGDLEDIVVRLKEM